MKSSTTATPCAGAEGPVGELVRADIERVTLCAAVGEAKHAMAAAMPKNADALSRFMVRIRELAICEPGRQYRAGVGWSVYQLVDATNVRHQGNVNTI